MQTLLDYRNFCETCAVFPPEKRQDYLYLGLISEIGELAALFKRQIRDGQEVPQDKLLAELGDIAWYTVMLVTKEDEKDLNRPIVSWTRVVSISYEKEMFSVFDQLLLNCVEGCLGVYDTFNQFTNFGFTLREIIDANVAKLSARKAANTIHGKGDNR